MVEQLSSPEHLDEAFGALAHPIRRSVLERLVEAPLRMTDIAARYDVSLAAVSKHVQVLERAGLVRRTVTGREHLIRAEPGPLAATEDWLARYRTFWEARLDALDAHLRERLDD